VISGDEEAPAFFLEQKGHARSDRVPLFENERG
jgi:hypothetical protein